MLFIDFLLEDRNMIDGKDTSLYKALLSKYKNKEKHLWFCTFTRLKSLQINFKSYALHKSDYNTPIGIYCYPIFLSKKNIESYDHHDVYSFDDLLSKRKDNFPYQDLQDNCILFKISNECYQNVWTNFSSNGYEQQYFDENKLKTKIEELQNILLSNYKKELLDYFKVSEEEIKEKLSELIEKIRPIVLSSMKNEGVKKPSTNYIGQFIYLLYQLVYKGLDHKSGKIDIHYYNILGKEKSNQATITTLLQKLGCSGLIDNGSGYIHTNEPKQAVFFKTSDLEQKISLYNDLQKNYDTYSPARKKQEDERIEQNKEKDLEQKSNRTTILKYIKKYYNDKIDDVLVNDYYKNFDENNYKEKNDIKNVIFYKIICNDINFNTCHFKQYKNSKIDCVKCNFDNCLFESKTDYGILKDCTINNCKFVTNGCFITLENCTLSSDKYIQAHHQIIYKNCTLKSPQNIIQIILYKLDLYKCSYEDYITKLSENSFKCDNPEIHITFNVHNWFVNADIKSNNYKETMNVIKSTKFFYQIKSISLQKNEEKIDLFTHLINNTFGENNVINIWCTERLD